MEWKILIADDDLEIVKLLKMRLSRKFECSFFEASNGQEALELTKINPLNLLILDIMMPKLSGEKVYYELRNDPDTKCLPILFCTAVNDRDFVRTLLSRIKDNVTDFMVKPIQISLLYSKVERLIDKANLLNVEFVVNEYGLGVCVLPQIGMEYSVQIIMIEGIFEDDEYSILINDRLQKGRLLNEHKPIIKIPYNEDGTPARLIFRFLNTRRRMLRIFYKII
jgi:CheY-like chemotaxis protein